MDLDKAMEFMLEQQAQFHVRQAQMQEQMQAQQAQQAQFQAQFEAQMQAQQAQQAVSQAKSDEWQAQFREGLADHDKRLAKAERLLVRGAKMLVIQRQEGRETDRRISALVDSQLGSKEDIERMKESTRQLQASLQAYLDSLRKSTNGN
jgi:hypothetical protein